MINLHDCGAGGVKRSQLCSIDIHKAVSPASMLYVLQVTNYSYLAGAQARLSAKLYEQTIRFSEDTTPSLVNVTLYEGRVACSSFPPSPSISLSCILATLLKISHANPSDMGL